MHQNPIQITVVAGLLLSASSAAHAGFVNLIADGSFQVPATDPGSFIALAEGSPIGAWQSQGGEILLVNSSYSIYDITFQAQSGSQWLDLTGGSTPSPNARIMQTISTEAGRQYELAFYLGSAWTGPGGRFLQPTVLVSAGTATPLAFTNANLVTGGVMNWELFSFIFTATGASTEIAFQYGNTGAPNWNIGVDTVSVVLVPGPGGLAAVLAASILGAQSRRRNRD